MQNKSIETGKLLNIEKRNSRFEDVCSAFDDSFCIISDNHLQCMESHSSPIATQFHYL